MLHIISSSNVDSEPLPGSSLESLWAKQWGYHSCLARVLPYLSFPFPSLTLSLPFLLPQIYLENLRSAVIA